VTIRDRDTMTQERVAADHVRQVIMDRMAAARA
jgi:glycyl-tRNA synthetase (class II)